MNGYVVTNWRENLSPKIEASGVHQVWHLQKEYTEQQLNYYRICYLTTDILADLGLGHALTCLCYPDKVNVFTL